MRRRGWQYYKTRKGKERRKGVGGVGGDGNNNGDGEGGGGGQGVACNAIPVPSLARRRVFNFFGETERDFFILGLISDYEYGLTTTDYGLPPFTSLQLRGN